MTTPMDQLKHLSSSSLPSLNELAEAFGTPSQKSRFLTLDIEASSPLLLASFEGSEGINQDYHFILECLSTSANIDLSRLPGQPARVGIATATGQRRYWHGVITTANLADSDGSLTRYQLTLQSALGLMHLRQNTLIFQEQSALDIAGQLFANYPNLHWRADVRSPLLTKAIYTQYQETDFEFLRRLLSENGLSWYIEHQQTQQLDDATAGHTVVIIDAEASLELPLGTPFALRYHRIDATEKTDSLTTFNECLALANQQTTIQHWDAEQVQAITGEASTTWPTGMPSLPPLDSLLHASLPTTLQAQAEYQATAHLQATRLLTHHYKGQGAVRTLQVAQRYEITQHPSLNGHTFIPLSIQHVATNNLTSGSAHSTKASLLEQGNYRQRFIAVPTGTPIAPTVLPKPQAPICCTAQVVGVPDEPLTSTRDHQVRIQFYWQRGAAPLAGGYTDTGDEGQGHAPQDHTSGTWVRVAETAAGAHSGSSFVPRIGSEVLVEFAQGDIDQPVIIGQLYHGNALPPFNAGEDSSANHPGALSGIHTQTLDGQPAGTWVFDDAPQQLRHSLQHTQANSQLNLGYVIEQPNNYRGRFLGEGATFTSRGWATLRASEGLLLSTTPRPHGQITQMDNQDAVAQLRATQEQVDNFGTAAGDGGGLNLAALEGLSKALPNLDAEEQGRYEEDVNGQAAEQPDGQPVARFSEPHLVLDSPAAISLSTPNSSAHYAGEHQLFASQGDAHLAAQGSLALATGDGASLYATDGGAKIIANHGSVSLQANDNALAILADKDATITSSGSSIEVNAQQKIVLSAGGATITLDGANLTLSAKGTFTVNTATHNWTAGDSQTAKAKALPKGLATLTPIALSGPSLLSPTYNQQFVATWGDTGIPVSGVNYVLKNNTNNTEESGITSQSGLIIQPLGSIKPEELSVIMLGEEKND
ncbi:type VI secretion system Vgr family protein [Thiopseudomonas alkaliphila]|uniref:type VI secretion system Vgr family protein n=1 Tax=Thiopseudomonas alkaliphila TaxID=1697053 RepID=UPI00069D03A4|nr:type VI secretion system Vgr family protein [Thiopseudomonas alkaliphila]